MAAKNAQAAKELAKQQAMMDANVAAMRHGGGAAASGAEGKGGGGGGKSNKQKRTEAFFAKQRVQANDSRAGKKAGGKDNNWY